MKIYQIKEHLATISIEYTSHAIVSFLSPSLSNTYTRTLTRARARTLKVTKTVYPVIVYSSSKSIKLLAKNEA